MTKTADVGDARIQEQKYAGGHSEDSSDLSSSTSLTKSFTKDSCSLSTSNTSQTQDKKASYKQDEQYWKAQYDQLLENYNRLQSLNQKLEDRLLQIVDECERNKQECVANVEYEKSTLMADVNKLSTKLVDARIKLHDYEEKEQLHAAECSSPCHKGGQYMTSCDKTKLKPREEPFDPNLV